MRQDEINKDLGSYLHDKKDKPFWKKSNAPKIKPHHEFDDEVIVRHEVDRTEVHTDGKAPTSVHHEAHEAIHHEPAAHHEEVAHHIQNVVHETKPVHDHKVLMEEEHHKDSKVASVPEDDDKTKIKVEDVEEKPKEESGLKKLFKKLSFSKDDDDDEPRQIGHMEMSDNPEITMDDEELRELLHGLHNWIIQLPSDKLERFKTSKEFEMYTKYLRKHNLIK